MKRTGEIYHKLLGYYYYRPCEDIRIVWTPLFLIINWQRQIPHVPHRTSGIKVS